MFPDGVMVPAPSPGTPYPAATQYPTSSPGNKQYVPSQRQLFEEEVLWFSLALVLLLVYLALRTFCPWAVVLRDLPNAVKRKSQALQQIVSTLRLGEKEMISQTGLDGYMTIRLIRFCSEVAGLICFFNLFVLVPVFHSQKQPKDCREYCRQNSNHTVEDAYLAKCVCQFVDKCSMANVPSAGPALWIPSIGMLFISLLVLVRLKHEYKEVVRVRLEFWRTRPSRLHTVFVDRIPRSLAPPKLLREYFETLFPGQVQDVELLVSVDELEKVGEARANTLLKLERAIALKVKEGKNPTHFSASNRGLCAGIHTVDSIETYASELEVLNSKFALLKAAQREHRKQLDDVTQYSAQPRQAFVTFKTVTPSVIASQTMIHPTMLVKLAPDPNDVRWNTLGERKTAFSHFARKLASRSLFAFVLLFWGAITSVVGALTSVDALAHQFHALNDFLVDNPGFVSWLNWASTLIYVILIALVYPIIALSVQMEVRIAESNVDRAILERYFLFLVVQVFVFYSIAGSVFKSSVEIINHPASVFTTLASTIPKNASFFIGFITIKTFWLYFDLVRGYNLVFAGLRRVCYGATLTNREFRYQACRVCWDFGFPAPTGLPSANANVLLIFFIAVSYSCIQPLVTLAAFVYLASAYVVFVLLLTTSSRLLYDGGGSFWTHTFWCITASLVTSQLTLVGTLLTKQGFEEAIFVFLVCVFTLVMSSHLSDQYREPATGVTLEVAVQLDQRACPSPTPRYVEPSRVGESEPTVFRYVDHVLLEPEFLHPSLSPEEQFHELGQTPRGSTGGDLGYARMLDLDTRSNTPYGTL
ncbi:hypothetical protein BASA81_002569 [Batrachochytrium salamandrivorans]|nr:hypothetical protein BASA81_002569 [Batrachochytrium salamandrivorans]